MRVLIFIYYSIYKISTVIKRREAIDHINACTLMSIMISTNLIMVTLPLRFIITKNTLTSFPINYIVKLIVGSIFILSYILLKKYFLTKENYISIIEEYDKKYDKNKKIIRFFGLIYILLTPLSFIILARFLSHL